jgi:hypothetical protein
MARTVRFSRALKALTADQEILSDLIGYFQDQMRDKIIERFQAGDLDNWDDPAFEAQLQQQLADMMAATPHTFDDLTKIAAMCAVLTNFVDDPEV